MISIPVCRITDTRDVLYDNMKKKITNFVSGDQITTSSVPNVERG